MKLLLVFLAIFVTVLAIAETPEEHQGEIDNNGTIDQPAALTENSDSKESKESAESEEQPPRTRRGIVDGVENAGKEAWNKVEDVGSAIVTEAKGLINKAENAI
uniref:Uncharacterized protein n=1 Tax=Caenorhabditis japonica TaxID=281687 RepID=A0A8R1EWP5_CAEJA